jgi:hypothetical protein
VSMQVDDLAYRLTDSSSLKNHPYSKYLTSPTETVFFDLFFHFFVENKGEIPVNFDLREFYKEGLDARMYGQ